MRGEQLKAAGQGTGKVPTSGEQPGNLGQGETAGGHHRNGALPRRVEGQIDEGAGVDDLAVAVEEFAAEHQPPASSSQ